MEIYTIGYGGWISSPHIGYTSLYVRTDVGILLDAGECTYARLAQCGLSWPDVVFISHRHGDHILGLPTFMLMARRVGKKLRVVADRETLEAAAELARLVGIENSLPYVEFVEASGSVTIGETKLTFAPTSHPVQTLAVRIEHGGKCAVYSSDTAPSDNIVELARGCDLLIHEVSGNPGQEEEAHRVGHSTTADAVEIAKRAGVRMLMPIHFYVDPPVVPPSVTLIIPTPCGRLPI
ncbi:MAG: MBL fold metallo-hydrolase [Pyrobaculum arsenaticum]|uniref:Beta-lactamase domain protein n=2 Tax=Pyrobaculum arsenaticum TaxID=121277 RepID=A4WLJ4_PYRAR|nr:MBL fold metallo-hydrolase [Pyrobaculum arsenaticum]ABP51261.1 beta-lactamase domain protein [Pyrobaculum arsenaticum DSM 13514]MCY0891852.1 MBL fold metallo-hydrolase [Pyrobaculum arsenaticum]NYR16369.1 MBL fold metallo-hydrolase [Pyrobaculum arsenaticum]